MFESHVTGRRSTRVREHHSVIKMVKRIKSRVIENGLVITCLGKIICESAYVEEQERETFSTQTGERVANVEAIVRQIIEAAITQIIRLR